MIDHPKIRRAILSLPEAAADESEESLGFSVAGKGMSWPYLARATPKGRREVVPGVLAVRCRMEKKEMLLEAAPEVFFDDAHYRGYPAVLVRLDAVEQDELTALLRDACRLLAPKAVVKRFDAGG